MSESFDWNYPGLNWSHFHSLANLLSLRNGGQAEPSSLPDTVLEADSDLDDDGDENAPSVDTRLAQQISKSEHGKLKRKFLDCLAEFAANKKGGAAVACTAMKENEDNINIWISRNEGFLDQDKPTYNSLGKLLSQVSCYRDDQYANLLWEEMVLYQQNRIEHSYIPDLRASFKAFDAYDVRSGTRIPENSTVTETALSDLRELLFERQSDDISILERYSKLVIASYDLRRTKIIEELLHNSPKATAKSKSLWLTVCLLARLRVAYQIFQDIALTLPSFQQVTITLVDRSSERTRPLQTPLKLNETFKILKLDPSPTNTEAVLGQNWNLTKVQRKFTERQKQKPNVHAEVQMIVSLNSNGASVSGLFPYLGCSKLSCFMCNRFIQAYGQFTTRGCHGRLFRPWTVPSVDCLTSGQPEKISKALLIVQQEVVKKLKASVKGQIAHERTSAIGGSSILGFRQKERSQRELQIDSLRLKTERDRIAEMFRRQTENSENSTKHPQFTTATTDLDVERMICEKPTSRKCSVCNKDHFCSYACQEKRNGSHLFTCSKRPLTSADYLWQSLMEDRMPRDEDVLEDFGFNNAISYEDKSHLLGVYRGLWLSDKVSAEDIHEWRVSGTLIEKIKGFYFGIPEKSRGQYFPWLLKNLHVLEHQLTKEEAQLKLIATLNDRARPYLDIDDRNKDHKELTPCAKRSSYFLLAEMLLRATPNPIEENWHSFGFVTCREHEESILLDIYQLLLTKSDGSFFYKFHNSRRSNFQPATFTQFWKAYEAGTLIQLMDSKGLKDLRSQLPYLEAFLSVPPTGPHLSVWDLKQCLEINDPIKYPPAPSVHMDYGFSNCENFEETCTLMEIYERVLKVASPLQLHAACLAGELFEFASGCIAMDEKWRPLMRNFYR